MKIGPINHGNQPVEQPDSRQKKDEPAQRAERPTDDLIISAEARERLSQERPREEIVVDDNRPVVDSVDYAPDKLRLIRERVDSGFYEQTAIIDRTVDKLVDEMLENIKLFYK
jgi:hypothetical protein